jgi:hypothetical protein
MGRTSRSELTEWAEQNVIGRMQINHATRDYIRGQMQARIAARERAGDRSSPAGRWTRRARTRLRQPTDNFVAIDVQR